MLNSNTSLNSKERKFAIAFLILVALFTIFDLFEDWSEGTTWEHVSIEAFIIALALFGAIYLWKETTSRLIKNNQSLKESLAESTKNVNKLKKENEALYQGFVDSVERKMSEWGLTTSEKDITFLLLKGLSVKEIATLRNSSENTVRQQSMSIYKKSNLEGRAQLAAFFIEDLLD